jgi:hypothetical protein
METRRIRRHARRHTYRTVTLAASLTALGIALGMALPRSMLAAALILVAAVCCVVVVAMTEDAIASTHGLHHVIRFPFRTSLSAALESFRSRFSGSVRAVFARSPKPDALALDEPDDDAEEWWGKQLPSSEPLLADSVPPVPELLALAEATDPEPISEPSVPVPVLAAPIASAHVPADDAPTGPGLVELALADTRRRIDALTKRFRRGSEDTGADLSTST